MSGPAAHRGSGGGGRPGPLLAAVLLVAVLLPACAGGPARRPLEDPTATAREALARTAPAGAWRLTLEWEYADRRGPVRGDGVLRYTAPDSLRLDLVGPGDGSMAVALTGRGLRTVGQIRELRVPPPPFLYAAAGLFRPGGAAPDEGWREDGQRVLVYRRPDSELRFRTREGRLVEVEERRDGRTVRRVQLTWPDSAEGPGWPGSAEYRDRVRESRARWTVVRVRRSESPFSPQIYDLPTASP